MPRLEYVGESLTQDASLGRRCRRGRRCGRGWRCVVAEHDLQLRRGGAEAFDAGRVTSVSHR